MAWSTPKEDWKAGDKASYVDINRIESNTAYLKTITDTVGATTITLTLGGVNVSNIVHPTCKLHKVGGLIYLFMSTWSCETTNPAGITITGTLPSGYAVTADHFGTVVFPLDVESSSVWYLLTGKFWMNGSGTAFSVVPEYTGYINSVWFEWEGAFGTGNVRAPLPIPAIIMVAA